MQKRVALLIAGALLLASCSTETPAQFPIASGPLKAGEISFASYAPANLAARVFDVVNQDQTAESNTGIAGHVQPMPADLLSAYAASKFRANGGAYTARFIVKQGSLTVHPVAAAAKDSSFWSFGFMKGDDNKAEVTLDLNVMVVATTPDGHGATINATTTQSQQAPVGSPEDNRKVYLDLASRAIQALDGEITRQLPVYFIGVTQP